MGLSPDLISQFVKTTNDNTKPKNETTVYGKVVVNDKGTYVRVGEGETSSLIPIRKVDAVQTTSTDIEDGDTVTLLIKDHTAIVTGNLTSPAARTDSTVKNTDLDSLEGHIADFEIILANKVDTDVFLAEVAIVDELQADSIRVKQSIAANSADISKLEADNVTINNTLVAQKASIDDLSAKKLDADVAKITYATIDALKAIDVSAYVLKSTYADFVQTTTEGLTAVNGDIENLKTNKLDAHTASITYATIVDLQAVNGSIDILESDVADINTLMFGSATGNVLQTSFANAVIAQLGNAQIKSAMIESIAASKITSGDIITNNVRVKSEDGSLLISDETMQISDGTRVRVQIGKDASNDYSINIWDADGKLMFSEGGISDSAIKEAIIRNDMVSDTANIAAHKLDIDSLFEEINDSTNTIKSTKVYLDDKKQTLDVAFTSLTTSVTDMGETISSQGTAISAIQGQISSKIWQQDITTAVDDISVGGRNYFVRKNMNNLAWTGTGLGQMYYYIGYSLPVNAGEEWSVYRTDTTNNRWAMYWFDTEPVVGAVEVSVAMRSDEQPANVVTHLTVPEGVTWLFIYLSNQGDEIPNIMLEKGNKASDWVPAIEDTDASIADMSTKYSEVLQDISSLTARVSSTESSVGALDNQLSELILDLDGFKTSVSKTYVTTNALAGYSTTNEMHAAIAQSASGITSSVSSTYATKAELGTTNTNVTNAASTANSAQNAINNLQIGGRNYFRPSLTVDLGCTGGSSTATLISTGSCKGYYIPVVAGEVWSVSRGNTDNNRFDYCFTTEEPKSGMDIYGWNQSYRNSLKIEGIVVPEGYNYLFLYLSNANDDVSTIKLEKGNRATDWTPAPEDMATSDDLTDLTNRVSSAESSITQLSNSITTNVTEITNLGTRMTTVEQTSESLTIAVDNAAKTATNYLNYSGGGLVVGNLTTDTLGKNVLIDSDSVDIRNGTTTLASFGSNTVVLGQNDRNSVISLCGGAARISANIAAASTSYPYRDAMLMESKEIELESVYCTITATNEYDLDTEPDITRIAQLYAIRSNSSSDVSNIRIVAEHTDNSDNTYVKTGFSALTYDASSNTRALMYAYDSGNKLYNSFEVYTTKATLDKPLYIDGIEFSGSNKVLWSGSYCMSANQTATLSENISEQANGIVLVFSRYSASTAHNYHFNMHYVPKAQISNHGGCGHSFMMTTDGTFSVFATKYLYIHDGKIVGNDANTSSGTGACGITYANNGFVLRYVIGV